MVGHFSTQRVVVKITAQHGVQPQDGRIALLTHGQPLVAAPVDEFFAATSHATCAEDMSPRARLRMLPNGNSVYSVGCVADLPATTPGQLASLTINGQRFDVAGSPIDLSIAHAVASANSHPLAKVLRIWYLLRK